MAQPTAIDHLKERTAELVAQDLRSESAVVFRLADLIAQAVGCGHAHRSIHEALSAGGLAISWTNYRIALGRARKAQRGQPPARAAAPPLRSPGWPVSAGVVLAEPPRESAPQPSMPQGCGEVRSVSGTSSTTRVMDALRQARDVAHSRDYGQIGRDLYRQQQRDKKQKD